MVFNFRAIFLVFFNTLKGNFFNKFCKAGSGSGSAKKIYADHSPSVKLFQPAKTKNINYFKKD